MTLSLLAWTTWLTECLRDVPSPAVNTRPKRIRRAPQICLFSVVEVHTPPSPFLSSIPFPVHTRRRITQTSSHPFSPRCSPSYPHPWPHPSLTTASPFLTLTLPLPHPWLAPPSLLLRPSLTSASLPHRHHRLVTQSGDGKICLPDSPASLPGSGALR